MVHSSLSEIADKDIIRLVGVNVVIAFLCKQSHTASHAMSSLTALNHHILRTTYLPARELSQRSFLLYLYCHPINRCRAASFLFVVLLAYFNISDA